jgi:uncharacterized protein DUF4166
MSRTAAAFHRQAANMDEPSLYQRMLGPDFERLGPVLQRFHSRDSGRAYGRLQVTRPARWWALLVAWAGGLPAAGSASLRLDVTPQGRGQQWVRSFGGQQLVTTQTAGTGCLLEGNGPLTLAFYMHVRQGGLAMRSQRAWFLGLPLPRILSPRVTAAVLPDPLGWQVRVRIRLPWLGEITRYEGSVICHDCLAKPAACAGSARRV